MNFIDDIKKYNPCNEQEIMDKDLILNAAMSYDNILLRDNDVMHITSSGYIVNKTRDKVLMIYHRIYDSWAWTGGHADGDSDLLHVAIKEANEETGLKNVKPIDDNIFSLDVLTVDGHVKRGKYVSSHLHLNVTYILEGDENEELVVNEDETKGVKWISIDQLGVYCSEPYMVRMVYNKLNEKIANMDA